MQGGEYIRFPFEEETEELINKEEEEEYYPREFDIDFTTGELWKAQELLQCGHI